MYGVLCGGEARTAFLVDRHDGVGVHRLGGGGGEGKSGIDDHLIVVYEVSGSGEGGLGVAGWVTVEIGNGLDGGLGHDLLGDGGGGGHVCERAGEVEEGGGKVVSTAGGGER